MTARDALSQAAARFGRGDLAGAARVLDDALRRQPRNPELLFQLGLLRRQQGRTNDAIGLLTRALAVAPSKAEIPYVLANCAMTVGRFDEAVARYQEALALTPAFPDAWNNLGAALLQIGRFPDALAALRRALEFRPDFPGADLNIGRTLVRLERYAEAIAPLRRAAVAMPGSTEAALELANALSATGDWEAAAHAYRSVLRLDPGQTAARHDLSVALQYLGRVGEAVESYRGAVAADPDNPVLLVSLGHALALERRFDEAIASLHRALTLDPDALRTLLMLGEVFTLMGRLDEALAAITHAVSVWPETADGHFVLGLTQVQRGETEAAIAAFRQCLKLDPSKSAARDELLFQLQAIGDWAAAEEIAPQVRADTDAALAAGRICDEKPLESIVRDADPARNLAVAAAHARKLKSHSPFGRRFAAPAAPDRLRLGYLSADYRDHPVSHAIEGVLCRHDRTRFSVTAYSYGADDSSVWRGRIERAVDRFVDLRGLGDDAAARRIRDDGIDVLIDLTVWTANERLAIAARRPAAIQVQYLGYPGTSGSAAFDYAIVDPVVVPAEHRDYWSERLIFLPNCYFPVDGELSIDAVGVTRRDCGLPDDGFVFCSFNQLFKIDRGVFETWMRVLAAVSGSVLWLPRRNPEAEARLREAARGFGIAPERLVFAPRVVDKTAHLARLSLGDLALDTLAYNGHTTTADALLAGVPVLTVAGRHFASRVSASMLHAAGLDDMVAVDIDQYDAIARHLATDREALRAIRRRLADLRREAPLFQISRLVAALETAYLRMAQSVRADVPAADIRL